jgi:hypothetical protein
LLSHFENNTETRPIMSMTRKNWWKKISAVFFLPVLATIFLASCDKPNLNLGTNFINNSNTNIVVIDTFSANLSTVLLDSFPTAGSGAMLIGSYNDPYFGYINSRSFLQIGRPASIPSITPFAVFDSISLIMRINKSFYGDTTIPQRYNVYQLTQNYLLPLPPLPRTFYNTTSIPFDPTPLGFKDVTIKPTALITSSIATKDTVQIMLPDTLGKSLLQLMYNKSVIVTNQTSFLDYFNGLCISADNSGKGVIFGFNDSVFIRLVYHEPGASFHYVSVNFPLNNAAFQFNQVSFDRTGTALTAFNGLPRPNPVVPLEVQSSATNHAAYVQSMTGLQAKVLFPTVFSLTQFSDYISLLRAELILKPVPGSYNPLLPLPPRLIASATSETNQLGGTLVSGSAIQYGNLVTDYITGVNTAYTYDITNYLKQQFTLTGNVLTQQGLMFSAPPPANFTAFNRVVFGDKNYKSFSAQLVVYYVSLPH